MPNGSSNHVFARAGEVVMVVWNNRPIEEALYLGEDVRQLDVWGRMTRLRETDAGHVIPVGPLPTFVTGQHVTNHTPQTVSFKCMLFVPNRRRMMSQVIELRQDRDTKIYRLPKGEQLIGETLWLRAEEIGGQRTLNYRFTAEK